MLRGTHNRVALLMLTAMLGACQGSGSTKTTDVPLAWVPITLPFSDAGLQVGLRIEASISVAGGAPIPASLDTGSAGLQLVADLLPKSTLAALPTSGSTIESVFPESGIDAKGYIAYATVSFGPDATTGQIPVAVYQKLTCLEGNPCEEIDGGSLEPYVFNGVPALLGLGMRNSAVGGFGNPIVQLAGEPPFIIQAPTPGTDGGILRIAPLAAEIATYATAQLSNTTAAPLNDGAPPWNDLALPACVIEGTPSRQFCGNALLDTGTPSIALNWAGNSGYIELAPGTAVSVAVGSSADPLGNFQVTVGSPPQFGLDDITLAPPLSDVGNLIVLGLPIFVRYDVLFDQANGKVGLRSAAGNP